MTLKIAKICFALVLAAATSAPAALAYGGGDGHGGNWGLGEDVYYPRNHGGGGWRAPRWNRRYVCYARNARGRTFSGIARGPRMAQREAMQSCRMNSRNPRSCYSLGCR